MSERITHGRRPLAFGAAALVAAAAFLIASAGPVAAGRPMEFTVTPSTAVVGDPVAAASDVPCFNYETDLTIEVWVVTDSDDPAEVFSTTGTLDDDFNWTATIDTSALPPGDYIVSARCRYGDEDYNNYQSQPLTLTAAVEPSTTTTTEDTTSTTATPGTPTAPTPEQPAAAPAGAVAGTPSYTG